MKPENSLERFQAFLTANGVELTSLKPEAGVNLALAFYQAERSDVVTGSADMLLFQWGTNNWGKPESFDVDITRQLKLDGSGEDESIWQLSLTFKFEPTEAMRRMGVGSRWCEDLADIATFGAFIHNTPVFQSLGKRKPEAAELDFGCVG